MNTFRGISEKKKSPGNVHFALCFPDVYEIGMSHLGFKILYDIINRLPYASAERVYSPWTDYEQYLIANKIRLSSLETKTSVNEFDIAGFSLQYELSYTTALNMLHLSEIPLRSEDRLNTIKKFPIIAAGGPCTVNPAPMSPFIDVFFIGDAEDSIIEFLNIMSEWKKSGETDRLSLLKSVASIEGLYVPLVHKKDSVIKRRFINNIDSAPYPVKPVVPYASIVHDRINIEVSRGCPMGCRFCQAGIIYRPLRERSPETILRIARESLQNTGYDEVSFTSLSAGDYSCLFPVVREFNNEFGASKIALSLPSLRVAAVNRDVLREIKSVRKTGFTIAPEAATQRLRNVINKNFTDDDYEKALSALFEEGWQSIKLYFMVGLPTETDEDIEAISEMAMKALKIAKKNTGRFVNIGVTVSPFIPKPHTPFQWFGHKASDISEKLTYLKKNLSGKKFKYKGHDEHMSLLEAVFARGDENLAPLIEKAWQLGCRLDGWSEMFNFSKWLEAMETTSIDAKSYAERTFEKDAAFPWDNINTGVTKDFLWKEYEKALIGETTPDCQKTCTACGLKCVEHRELNSKSPELSSTQHAARSTQHTQHIRVRVQYSKTGILRHLSHLELAGAIIKALRRAKVSFDFSKGFHPTPRVSFGPPLSVGVAGEKEYFDMEVFLPFNIEFHMTELNNTLPQGIEIHKMEIVSSDMPSLTSFIKRYDYLLRVRDDSTLMPQEKPASLIIKREKRIVDAAPCIEAIAIIDDKTARLTLIDTTEVNARVGEIVNALPGFEIEKLEITRTAVYGYKDGWKEPL
jgi:radical SAM family uncharacterized protein/radical SAM-linked protein